MLWRVNCLSILPSSTELWRYKYPPREPKRRQMWLREHRTIHTSQMPTRRAIWNLLANQSLKQDWRTGQASQKSFCVGENACPAPGIQWRCAGPSRPPGGPLVHRRAELLQGTEGLAAAVARRPAGGAALQRGRLPGSGAGWLPQSTCHPSLCMKAPPSPASLCFPPRGFLLPFPLADADCLPPSSWGRWRRGGPWQRHPPP